MTSGRRYAKPSNGGYLLDHSTCSLRLAIQSKYKSTGRLTNSKQDMPAFAFFHPLPTSSRPQSPLILTLLLVLNLS